MARIFAVTLSRVPRWNDSQPMEEQQDWRAHAVCMNGMKAEGFVVLGGPLEGTREVLLILRADGPEQIRSRLAGDCWHQNGLLRIVQIVPWQLRLGSLE
jgi:hypothetical protein